jgi:hypothetical protein
MCGKKNPPLVAPAVLVPMMSPQKMLLVPPDNVAPGPKKILPPDNMRMKPLRPM